MPAYLSRLRGMNDEALRHQSLNKQKKTGYTLRKGYPMRFGLRLDYSDFSISLTSKRYPASSEAFCVAPRKAPKSNWQK